MATLEPGKGLVKGLGKDVLDSLVPKSKDAQPWQDGMEQTPSQQRMGPCNLQPGPSQRRTYL